MCIILVNIVLGSLVLTFYMLNIIMYLHIMSFLSTKIALLEVAEIVPFLHVNTMAADDLAT